MHIKVHIHNVTYKDKEIENKVVVVVVVVVGNFMKSSVVYGASQYECL